jgi:quinol monooxygenase YgiN
MHPQAAAQSPIDLIATIEARPEDLPAAVALLLEYGEIVSGEPGNLRFEAYRDRESGAMVVVERYASAEAFEAHLANPANAEFNTKLAGILGGGGSTLQMLDRLG